MIVPLTGRARLRCGLARSLLLALVALVAGCGAGDRESEAAAVAGLVEGAGFVDVGGETSRFSGVVLDHAGAPLSGVAVAMCGSACWPARTDGNGRFIFEELPVERYALDVRGESVAERPLTSVVFPVELAAGVQELPAPVRLQDAVPATRWNDTDAMSLSGLVLVPSAGVDLAALERIDEAAASGAAEHRVAFGGARVPAGAWPAYRLVLDDVAYEPVAMWALRPFGVRTGAPVGIRVSHPEPDAPRELAFFTVDLVTGVAEALGRAVIDGSMVRTEPGRGIETLTMIILAARRHAEP